MASPALDDAVTDLESFCRQLSTALGALAAARPDLQGDAQGYDTLLRSLRETYDAAEKSAAALDDGIESAASDAAEALEALTEQAGDLRETVDGLAEAAGWQAEAIDVELADRARTIDAGWSALWSTAWTELRDSLGGTAADLGRWTEEADVAFTALDRAFEEAVSTVDHERNETVIALERAARSTHQADIQLQGLYLHAPTVAKELEDLFSEGTEEARGLITDWRQRMEGEAAVTQSAVKTLAADAHAAVVGEHARLSAAHDALVAALEHIDVELGQTAAEADDGRDQAEQAAALEPELRQTEARVAAIRALIASFEPT
jgi:hypothetical protein